MPVKYPRPPWPDGLLNLAARLAGEGAGRGAPKSVELRRAVSTAYYALFHELVIQATRVLVGSDDAVQDGKSSTATRWFAHKDINDLAQAVNGTGQKARAIADVLGEPHADLRRVAGAFVNLQAARHAADYDYNFILRRADALFFVREARDAILAVRRLQQEEDLSYQRFLRLMVAVRTADHKATVLRQPVPASRV